MIIGNEKVFELISEYQNNYPIYEQFTNRLKLLFEKLLISNGISFLQIETRVKSLPSFLDKVYRLISTNKFLSNNFNDLVGIRLITYYNEDVYQIAALIEREFDVYSKNSEYESHNRSPDQFGYSSLHYKISLTPQSSYPAELEKFKNIIFEVQIRTVVQHAWATIDHKIRYKTAEEIPRDIQREIFQLSALFELADNQFLSIKKKLAAKARMELGKYKKGDLSAKINALTLEHFFKTHQAVIQLLVDRAVEIGFKETTIQHDPNSIRYLLMLFQRLGIVTIGELEDLFVKAQEKGPKIMEKIYHIVTKKNVVPINYPFPIIILIIITLRLKVIKFEDMDTDKVVNELLKSTVKSISLSLENTK